MKASALLVGVNAPGDEAPLHFAEGDCQLMAYMLGEVGFDPPEIVCGAMATEQAIHAAFLKLVEQRPAVLLCYFAGHARLTGEGLLFRLPSRRQREPNGILFPRFVDSAVIDPETDLICILDTCANTDSSRPQAKGKHPEQVFGQFVGRSAGAGSRGSTKAISGRARGALVYLLAASHSQEAWEDPRLRSGVFTHYLCRSIRELTRHPSRLDMKTVFERAAKNLKAYVEQRGLSQSPVLNPPDGAGVCLREFPVIRPFVAKLEASS